VKPMDFSLKDYENIFLGGQVWAGHSTPAINTFIGKADLKGKKVYLFLVLADNKEPRKVIDSLTKRIEKRGGSVVDSLYITTKMGSVITPEDIREKVSGWVGRIGI
jgi:hypothetical protein